MRPPLLRAPSFRRAALALACLALPAAAAAWGGLDEVGTSGAAWLLQPSSARVLAMGGAGTAGGAGVEGWWWNPAATAGFPNFNTELSFRRQFADTDFGFLSLAWPTPWGVPALGLMSVQTVRIPGYDANGAFTNELATRDLALKFGWALGTDRWRAGLAATYLQQDHAIARSTGWGMDAGVQTDVLPGVQAGVALLRLGRTQEGDPLPAEVRLGGSARPVTTVAVAVDLVSPQDAQIYLAAGAEWRPVQAAAVRAGWRTGPASSWQLGTAAYFTAGFGLTWQGLNLDYAYEPAGLLGDSHHLSLGYRWTVEPGSATRAAVAKPAPTPVPRLQILPRAYEGRIVIQPKAALREVQAKTIQFRVRDPEGKIVRTFDFAGQTLPKELVWDGKDDQGRLVDQDRRYTFDIEYITPQGVRNEVLPWPEVLPVRKLWFQQGGEGVAPEAWFRPTGSQERVAAWRLTVLDQASRLPVRELSGTGPLPPELEWDGRDRSGAWAPPGAKYVYQLELQDAEQGRVRIEHPVIAVPAEVISRTGGRVRIKILGILFDFARSVIRAEMADKIEKAAEIARHGGTILSIQGHADEIGTRRANELISRQRAGAVHAMLGRDGLPGHDRIEVQGFGNDYPVATGGGEEARAQNRRVVIVLTVPEPVVLPDRPAPDAAVDAPKPGDKR